MAPLLVGRHIERCMGSQSKPHAPLAIVRWTRRVGGMSHPLHRFVDKVRPVNDPNECWIWEGAVGSDGYGRVRRKGATFSAHRYSYELFKGPVPEELCVMHRCDVPLCVNPTHLCLGTKADNTQDMLEKKRAGNTVHKLSYDKVQEVRALLRKGVTKREISERFDICRSTVQDIESGSTWAEDPNQRRLFP